MLYIAHGFPSGQVRSTAIYPTGSARAKFVMLKFVVHILQCHYCHVFTSFDKWTVIK